ncbi:hypothetical protein [Sodalis-like endosymbiont of Proechinophthirus fluctus]|uniref:hypothetical protein n=1 Tax=Sodalis-like endosymbiont of Proechinophthirus fluctus TaxID=1462730 RepID=UPI000AFC427E|nr:hypothetical protein [Sodalis-like endosymbiont of Proechinophthirus fluctus]
MLCGTRPNQHIILLALYRLLFSLLVGRQRLFYLLLVRRTTKQLANSANHRQGQ